MCSADRFLMKRKYFSAIGISAKTRQLHVGVKRYTTSNKIIGKKYINIYKNDFFITLVIGLLIDYMVPPDFLNLSW